MPSSILSDPNLRREILEEFSNNLNPAYLYEDDDDENEDDYILFYYPK